MAIHAYGPHAKLKLCPLTPGTQLVNDVRVAADTEPGFISFLFRSLFELADSPVQSASVKMLSVHEPLVACALAHSIYESKEYGGVMQPEEVVTL